MKVIKEVLESVRLEREGMEEPWEGGLNYSSCKGGCWLCWGMAFVVNITSKHVTYSWFINVLYLLLSMC